MDNFLNFQAEQELPNIVNPIEQKNSHYSTLNEEQIQPEVIVSVLKEYCSNDSIPIEHTLSFDQLLEGIKFNRYQIQSYICNVLFGMSEGAQLAVFTITIPILKQQWGVPVQIVSMQASLVFIGFLIGSSLSGQFSDKIGRRLPYIISTLMTIIVCILIAFSENIYQMLVFRGLLGLSVGIFAPCCVSLLNEITPVDLKGSLMSIFLLSVSLGQIYGLLLSSLILDSLTQGDWRLLTILSTLPAMIAWPLSLFWINESPPFDLLIGNFDSAFKTIQKMIIINGSDVELNDTIRYQLKNWVHKQNKKQIGQPKVMIKLLFTEGRYKITLLLWGISLILSFLYYGNVLILPYILSNLNSQQDFISSDSISLLIISCISDLFGSIFSVFFIQRKEFGLVNSLIILFSLNCIISFITYSNQEYFIVWIILQKFFLAMIFTFLYQLAVEFYPTKIRATGFGNTIAIGRLGVVIMPWILMSLVQIQLLYPFLLFSLLSLLAVILNAFLPKERIDQDLQ